MEGIQNQKDLIIEMIDALRACESELDAINNSELVNKINELLGRTSSELTGILDEESLNKLVIRVKEDNEPISEEDMDDLLMMFGY